MIEQKTEDNNRCSVRHQNIKTRKHRVVLGLERRVDDKRLQYQFDSP